jgi:hypothetical protein
MHVYVEKSFYVEFILHEWNRSLVTPSDATDKQNLPLDTNVQSDAETSLKLLDMAQHPNAALQLMLQTTESTNKRAENPQLATKSRPPYNSHNGRQD